MGPPSSNIRSQLRLAWRLACARLEGRPLILSHLITGSCNARCETCLWRADVDETSPAAVEELSTEEVAWLYREAGAAGFPQLVVWGGEPLLRLDLPELLEVAGASGLSVALITNGRLLPQRWPALRGRVHTLIVSLDDVGAAHDRLRGIQGLYSGLDQFLTGLKSDPLRPRLLVNTVLSRLNRGALRRVAPVAKRWQAGLYFCPMETGAMLTTGFSTSKWSLALPPQELRETSELARLLQEAGYPLLSSRRYLDLLARDPELNAYTCSAPNAVLTVKADGSIRDCTRRDVPLASVRDLRETGTSLLESIRQTQYRAMLGRAASCTVCNNPDVLETSWAWQLRPFMLRQALRLGIRWVWTVRGSAHSRPVRTCAENSRVRVLRRSRLDPGGPDDEEPADPGHSGADHRQCLPVRPWAARSVRLVDGGRLVDGTARSSRWRLSEYVQFWRGTVRIQPAERAGEGRASRRVHGRSRRITMLLVTAKVEDMDRFLGVFSTKGAEKRAKHGSKGSTLFRDPNEEKRVWAAFDWDTEGWESFVSDPEVPAIFKEAGLIGQPQAVELVGTYDA